MSKRKNVTPSMIRALHSIVKTPGHDHKKPQAQTIKALTDRGLLDANGLITVSALNYIGNMHKRIVRDCVYRGRCEIPGMSGAVLDHLISTFGWTETVRDCVNWDHNRYICADGEETFQDHSHTYTPGAVLSFQLKIDRRVKDLILGKTPRRPLHSRAADRSRNQRKNQRKRNARNARRARQIVAKPNNRTAVQLYTQIARNVKKTIEGCERVIRWAEHRITRVRRKTPHLERAAKARINDQRIEAENMIELSRMRKRNAYAALSVDQRFFIDRRVFA